MKVIATICSRHKKEGMELLPAHDRYIGEHIWKVAAIAVEAGIPFYILSGKYGLISAETEIPNYDYYLEREQIDSLAEIIKAQIIEAGITEIDFYSEEKESWAPYIEAMRKGTKLAGVPLKIHQL